MSIDEKALKKAVSEMRGEWSYFPTTDDEWEKAFKKALETYEAAKASEQPDHLLSEEELSDHDPEGDAYAKGYADGYKAKATGMERESQQPVDTSGNYWKTRYLLLEAKTERKSVNPMNVIRLDEDGEVDDVAITGDLFRMERMNDGDWWVCIYRGDKRTAFSLTANSNNKAILSEDSIGCHDDTKSSQIEGD